VTTPTIETARLRLRPLSFADADEVRRLADDPRVSGPTARIPQPFELSDAIEWIDGRVRSLDRLAWAIELRENGALTGAVGLVVDQEAHAALDYWIGAEHWGRGIATEAARAALHHGFITLGLEEIVALHLAHNGASGRVLAKCGMRHLGPSVDLVRGELAAVERYAISRSEYLARVDRIDDLGT